MELSTHEKAAISELLQIIAQDKQLNNRAIDLPLYYIAKPTHTIKDIIIASKEIANNIDFDTILANPLLSALYKTKLAIVSATDLPNRTSIADKPKYIVIDSIEGNPETYLIELPGV